MRLPPNDRLAHLADALSDFDNSTIRADATYRRPLRRVGSYEYNVALGDKCAQAFAEFFETIGISSAQLTVIRYRKDKPICTDQTEDCRQKNRRAHIVAQN